MEALLTENICSRPLASHAYRSNTYQTRTERSIEIRGQCVRNYASAIGTEVLTSEIRVRDEREVIRWSVDFSEYILTEASLPEPQQLLSQFPGQIPAAIDKRLQHSALDVLVWLTCANTEALQNGQNRMDWFFYIDHHIDENDIPMVAVEHAITDLTRWLHEPSYISDIQWVNIANEMLDAFLSDMGCTPSQREVIIEDIELYYRAMIREKQPLTCTEYVRNRVASIGSYPELESCFAYKKIDLPAHQRVQAEMMKYCKSWLVSLQNDVASAAMEIGEGNHLNLMSYFPSLHEYVAFVETAYASTLRSFHTLRPRSNDEALFEYWKACNQWICGSLLWHLSSPRYGGAMVSLDTLVPKIASYVYHSA